METETTLWKIKDPKKKRKFFTIRIIGRDEYWSFEHSGISDDVLKTYGPGFKESHFRVVEMWLERNNIHHMRTEVREMIKQITGEKSSPRSVPSSFVG